MSIKPPKRQGEFTPAGAGPNTGYQVPMVHGFPSPFVPYDTKKSKEYGAKYAEMMLADWLKQDTGFWGSQRRRYHEAKLYSMGMQPENKYKSIISSNKRVKTLNLIYRIQSVIPKFLKTLVEQFMELDEAPRCTAIDPFSMQEKQDEKLTAEMALEHKPFIDELEQESGVKTIPDNLKFESQQALNLYYEMFYKQGKELAFEQALAYILSENDERQQKREHIRNFAIYNKSGVKTTLNPDGTITKRVVDPEMLVTSFSKKEDYRDIVHAGEIIDMSISELRILAAGEISEEEIYKIYCAANKGVANRTFDQSWRTAYDRFYDGHQVQVLHFEFLSVDRMVKQERTVASGNKMLFSEPDTFKLKPQETDRVLHEKSIQYRYSGYYVINTKQCFKYGRDKMIERSFNVQKLSKCNLTYDIYEPEQYNMNSRSWVEHIITFADLMQVTALKIQALVAKAKPSGIAVDIRGLEGVMNGKGGEVFKPLELISIYEETGNILYRSMSADGRAYQGKPIEEVRNGINGGELNSLIVLYNQYLKQIQDATGMNSVADGSFNGGQESVGGAKLKLMASNRATRYIYEAYLNLLKRSSQKGANQFQLSVMYNMNNEYWETAIGKDALDCVRDGNNPHELSDYGIEIDALPDDNKRAEINAAIQDAAAKGVISHKDVFIIRELRNYKYAIAYLDYVEKKAKEEAAQQAQANSQMQAQIQAASAKGKADGDIAVNTNKIQGEIEKEVTIGKIKEELQTQLFYQKMVELGKMTIEQYEAKFGLGPNSQANAAMAAPQPPMPSQEQQLPQDPAMMQPEEQTTQEDPQMQLQ